ncbi:hypothetical protein C8R43DRAFT_1207688 [Mycena crocata]|nr:hypothetical protein C8R43DRAFT_1207688 [Mycena crocata]
MPMRPVFIPALISRVASRPVLMRTGSPPARSSMLPENTLRAAEKAAGIYRTLAETNTTFTEDLAASLHNLRISLRTVDRHVEAACVDEEAVAFRRKLWEKDPKLDEDLAASIYNRALDRSEEAQRADEESMALPWALLREKLANSLHSLRMGLRAINCYEDVLRVDEKTVALCRKLAETDPAVTKDLAWSLENLGRSLRLT